MDNPSETTTTPTFADMADKFYGPDVSEPVTESAETVAEEPKVEAVETVEAESTETSEVEGEEAEEGETETDEDDPEIEWNTRAGESHKVKLSELRDGYMRQAKFTKETQALADERKRFDEVKTQSAAKLQVLSEIEADLSQMLMADFANVNWNEVRDTDPSQYLALKEAKEQREQAIAGMKAKADTLKAEIARDESVKLADSLGWSDVTKRDGDIKLIESYVNEAGIPAEVFAAVSNHKLMTALREAALYRQLQKKTPGVTNKVREAPKANAKPVKAPQPVVQKTGADLMYN